MNGRHWLVPLLMGAQAPTGTGQRELIAREVFSTNKFNKILSCNYLD
jgi:hypothetical protein